MFNWIKRILGFAITTIAVPVVTSKYGADWGIAVGTVGGAVLHQAERFDVKTAKPKE